MASFAFLLRWNDLQPSYMAMFVTWNPRIWLRSFLLTKLPKHVILKLFRQKKYLSAHYFPATSFIDSHR